MFVSKGCALESHFSIFFLIFAYSELLAAHTNEIKHDFQQTHFGALNIRIILNKMDVISLVNA